MQIDIYGQSFPLTPAISRHVTHRIETALAAVAGTSVRGAMARLRDVNGTRGGVDKGCRIVVWLDGRKTVVADAVDRDLYVAVDIAATRLKQSVWRLLRRSRTLRREHGNRTLRRLVS